MFENLLRDERSVRLRSVLGSIYLVGGALRDTLLKRPVEDLDYACPLSATEVEIRCSRAGLRVYRTGLRHETLTIIPVETLPSVEVTSFRGRKKTDLNQDLELRDFTINALALDCLSGTLHDPHAGVQDIEKRILRAVVSAEARYREDPLRMLRLVRLANELDFTIAEETLEAAIQLSGLLEQVSVERIRDELSLILCSQAPDKGFLLLQKLHILKVILPEVERFVDFEQNEFHSLDLFSHTLQAVKKTSDDLTTRLATLFHDVGKPDTLSVDEQGRRHFYKHEVLGAEQTKAILKRLKYPQKLTEDVTQLVRLHMRPISAGDSGLRRLLRDTGELYPKWRDLKEADASSCKLDKQLLKKELAIFDERIKALLESKSSFIELELRGQDLIELGLSPGPRFGKILKSLEAAILENPDLNNRKTILEKVRAGLEDGSF